MNILHVTTYCPTVSTGGTERYIADLIPGLRKLGMTGRIAWLTDDPHREPFLAGDIQVTPLPAPAMRIDPPPVELAPRVERLLDAERPDVVHFHTFGLAEAQMARLAHARRIPYAFTYHSPAWTCRRENLLLWGRRLCDGEVRTMRCSACKSQERIGGAPALGWLAALGSRALGWAASPSPTKAHRRLAFVADTARYRASLREFLGACDRTIALKQIAGEVLLRNGTPADRLQICHSGAPADVAQAAPAAVTGPAVFTVGFVGRVSWVKGVHILVEAFRAANLPEARVRLCGWSDTEDRYQRQLRLSIGDDPRIERVPVLPFAAMKAEYAKMTLLALPSIWMEMGPLVLHEAWALGLVVYGSATIGEAAELRARGRLVAPNTPEAWADALRKAYELHQQGRWIEESQRIQKAGPRRTLADVAEEVAACYRAMIAPRSEPAAAAP